MIKTLTGSHLNRRHSAGLIPLYIYSPNPKFVLRCIAAISFRFRQCRRPRKSYRPSDLLLNCVARVSRLYYPTLSLVSKSFRSLLASPQLYKARSLLDRTESCLYVCLELDSFENPSWFALCRKPDKPLTYDTSNKEKKSSVYVLAKVPGPHSPPMDCGGSRSSTCEIPMNLNGIVIVR
ncbi:hypothetical protein CARUB_v10006506mg [Capsella rubella]|uniref:F-box domain-containing protein n=1 Tax=Capsella rubella TaxID=81985 RepID=R0H0F4_9BRAS|nr:hypothetical protein CARUB_v10006506mg [Capsella rubella]